MTLVIGRAVYDILIVNYGSLIQLSSALLRCLGLHRRWRHLRILRARDLRHTSGHRRAHCADAFAAGLAHSRRRRFAPFRPQLGIKVRQTVFMSYVISGLCAGFAGFLIACRLSGAGPGTGLNMEILAITAAVVGGNSLGGGRGSVAKSIMGAIIVLVMNNGLIRLGYGTGTNQMVLGIMLAVAVILDIRWLKNRHKVLNELYVAPIYHRMGETQSAVPDSGTPYALNNRIAHTEYIGLGELEGPEDVVLDKDDHLYCGTRHGEIVRFFAPDYKRSEIFCPYRRLPARPRSGQGQQHPFLRRRHGALSDFPQRRSEAGFRRDQPLLHTSIVDDARLRDPNDLDIAPDGKIYFTDSTTRYDAHDWAIDSIEGRPTGRLLVFDPKTGETKTLLDNYRYANGVCMAHDGKVAVLRRELGLPRAPLLAGRAQGGHG